MNDCHRRNLRAFPLDSLRFTISRPTESSSALSPLLLCRLGPFPAKCGPGLLRQMRNCTFLFRGPGCLLDISAGCLPLFGRCHSLLPQIVNKRYRTKEEQQM